MPTKVLYDTDFELIGEASLDSRNRVALTKAVEALRQRFGSVEKLHFAVMCNKDGQILLVPETTIPLREAWLYRNPAALKSVLIGIAQAERGELLDRGSFAQYADDDAE